MIVVDASGDSKATLRIWDISKQKQIVCMKLNNSPETNIVGIDWDENGNIVTASLDTIYLIKYDNAKLTQTKIFKQTCGVFQTRYSPHEKNVFAAALLDSTIKIFNENNEKPLKVLSGHTKKVFGIAFNKKTNILASTSDDCKIGVWDLDKNTNHFLLGHTHNTRQVVWVPDSPSLLISGSWDGTIRIWNVDACICMCQINEHHSDVYGLDISPHYPFLLLSCSRDNSIRFWNLIQPKSVDCFLNFTQIKNYFEFNLLESQLQSADYSSDDISKAEIVSSYFYVINILYIIVS